jgi:membrane associated rhomboid family serine protease
MFQQIPPGTRNILILIGLIGMAQIALPKVGFEVEPLYLFYPDSNLFRPWQLVSHMFCHGGFTHFLFNTIALFSFGGIVESRLGTKKFLYLFFISGLGAVLVHFLSVGFQTYQISGELFPNFSGLIPNPENQPVYGISTGKGTAHYGPMLGASGALYGIMTAFAFFNPNEKMIFLFIPYPIKAKYLVPIIVGLDIVLGFGGVQNDPIAHFAHIGGAITGFLFAKIWYNNWMKKRWQ